MVVRGTKVIIAVLPDGKSEFTFVDGTGEIIPCGGASRDALTGQTLITTPKCDGVSVGPRTSFDNAVEADVLSSASNSNDGTGNDNQFSPQNSTPSTGGNTPNPPGPPGPARASGSSGAPRQRRPPGRRLRQQVAFGRAASRKASLPGRRQRSAGPHRRPGLCRPSCAAAAPTPEDPTDHD